MSDMMDAYWRAPPIARTLATAAFAISISVHLQFLPYEWFHFSPWLLVKLPPQIWRLVTSFLITGPQLGMLFDTYFLYSYLVGLEVGNPRFPRREDVIWYLIFVSGIITVLCTYLFGGGVFLPALILAMCRTVTQDQRGMKASFYFVTIPAQLVPFCMMFVSLLFPGGVYTFMMQLMGFIAAHVYDFLARIYPEFSGGSNLIPTPGFLSRLVQTPRIYERSFGTAIRPPSEQISGRSTGASVGGGPLPDAWRTRGSGRRLGD